MSFLLPEKLKYDDDTQEQLDRLTDAVNALIAYLGEEDRILREAALASRLD